MESSTNPTGTAQPKGFPDSMTASGGKDSEVTSKPQLHDQRPISASQSRSSKFSAALDDASAGKRRKMSGGTSISGAVTDFNEVHKNAKNKTGTDGAGGSDGRNKRQKMSGGTLSSGAVTDSNQAQKKAKIKAGIDSPGGSDGRNKRVGCRKTSPVSKQAQKSEKTTAAASNSSAVSKTRKKDLESEIDHDGRDESQSRATGTSRCNVSSVDATSNPGTSASTECAASTRRCATEGTTLNPEGASSGNASPTSGKKMSGFEIVKEALSSFRKTRKSQELESSRACGAECIKEDNALQNSEKPEAPVTNPFPAAEDAKRHDVPEDAGKPVPSKCLESAEKDKKGEKSTTSQPKVSDNASKPPQEHKDATEISGISGRLRKAAALTDTFRKRSPSCSSASPSGKSRRPIGTGPPGSSECGKVKDIKEASGSSSPSQKPEGGQATSTTSLGQTDRCRRTAAGLLFTVVVLSLLTVNLWRVLSSHDPLDRPPVSPTEMGVFSSWGIVGHRDCANTTRNILRRNGTVGDVAVAVTLCMCVALPNRCGIGGGLYAVYYNAEARRAVVIDGRETAPSVTNWTIFDKNKKPAEALYVGVPGQMIALETLLNLTGTAVPWPDLFADAINLAERGFPIGQELADIIASVTDKQASSLHDIFWRDGRPLKAGEVLVQSALAGTLRELAQKNVSVYGGTLAGVLVEDLRAEGGLVTLEDLSTYRVNVTDPIHFPLGGGYTLLAPRPPAGGIYLGLVLAVLSRFVEQHPDGSLPDDSMTAHRLVEALKFSFGRRSVLGDPHYTNMDGVVAAAVSPAVATKIARTIASHKGPSSEASYYGAPFSGWLGAGTAHFGFLAPNGDAIVLASSLNSMFGSTVLSPRTGVLFNDVIRDFDLPQSADQYNMSMSPRNEVAPGRRPLSSLAPSLVVREGEGVVMAVSASGGGRIISGIAQVVMRVLWMGQTVKQAVDWGRLHHQFIPDTLYAERLVSREIVDTLKFLGHATEVQASWPNDVMAMARRLGHIYATYDYRRQTNNFVDGE